MDKVIGLIVIGIFICIMGAINMTGNISTLHWYHRKRVTEENRLPFGRLVGLGTIICGVSVIVCGCLSFVALKTQNLIFETISNGVIGIGLVIGIGISFYAMIKYNKGIL